MSEHPERAVRCAACGAEPGEPCRDVTGGLDGSRDLSSLWVLRGRSHHRRTLHWRDSRPRSAWPRTPPDILEIVLHSGCIPIPAVGGWLSAGSRCATASGGVTPPYPRAAMRRTPRGLLEHHRWLAASALAEAERRGDRRSAGWIRAAVGGLAPSRAAQRSELSAADIEAMCAYLWDLDACLPIPRPALRPLVTPEMRRRAAVAGLPLFTEVA